MQKDHFFKFKLKIFNEMLKIENILNYHIVFLFLSSKRVMIFFFKKYRSHLTNS